MTGGGCNINTFSARYYFRHLGFPIAYNKFGIRMYGLVSIAAAVTLIHLVIFPVSQVSSMQLQESWGRGESKRFI